MNAVRAFALLAFLLGNAALLYFIPFLADFPWAPFSVNRSDVRLPAPAWSVDFALMIVFGLQHSVMARPAFKSWQTRAVPSSAERSVYVFASAVALTALMTLWQPMPTIVWDAGAIASVFWALFALGFALVFAAASLIDVLDLFGLKQAFAISPHSTPFKTPWLYRQIRHPIMSGMILAVWSAPIMTQGRLFLAAMMTVYILIALRFEERDLRAAHSEYEDYARRVPRLIPRFGLRST